jgi:PAS domain S-box-containing protein
MAIPLAILAGIPASADSAVGAWLGSPSGRLLLLLCLLALLLFSLLMILVPLMRRSTALLLRRLTSHVEALRLGAPARLSAEREEGEARDLVHSLDRLLSEAEERMRGLDEERGRLAKILDAPVEGGVLATDSEGRITVFSRGACALLGYEAGDLTGRSAEVLFTEESWKEILPRLARRSLSHTGSTLRTEMVRRDRSRLPVSLAAARSESPSKGFVALFHSVADHTDLEGRVKEAERRLEAVMESMQDSVLVVKNGRIHSANAPSEVLLSIPRNELVGKRFAELVSSEDLLPALERMEKTLRGGASDEFPATLRPTGSASVPREVRVRLVRLEEGEEPALLASLRNEGDRRQLESRLQADRKLLDATLDSTSEGILVQELSGSAPVNILVNQSLESLLGVDGEEILNWSESRLHQELKERGAAAEELEKISAASQEEGSRCAILDLESPSPRSLEITCGPLRMAGGDLRGRIFTFRDVTARREADRALREGHEALAASEQQLQRAVQELESTRSDLAKRNTQLEKLNRELRSVDEMKSNLLANVSHELQTPLVLIKGYTEMILKRKIGPLTAEQEKGLSVALKNIDRLVEMIDNLLDFSRMERGESPLDLEEFPLWQIVDEVVELIREKIRSKDLSLTTEYETDDLMVRADRGKISQVFINLLTNAIKFNRQGGRVGVRVTAGEPGTLNVEIRDTGIGIPPEEQDRIFERFYQVDASANRRAEGTGIGLSIVRDILALHGCSIRVESREGEGSRFIFTLPLGRTASAPRPVSVRSRSVPQEGQGQRR